MSERKIQKWGWGILLAVSAMLVLNGIGWFFGILRLLGSQSFLTPGLLRLGNIAAFAMLFGLLAGPALVAGSIPPKNRWSGGCC